MQLIRDKLVDLENEDKGELTGRRVTWCAASCGSINLDLLPAAPKDP